MNDQKYIVTHGGNAHLDDFLSCCLVLSKEDNIDRIERRAHTLAEIRDKNVWLLDIGTDFDPQKKIIDHHQAVMQDCTLSLLLKYWKRWDEATKVFGWLERVVLIDSIGPRNTLEKLHLPFSVLYQFDSYLEIVILDIFEEKKVIKRGSSLFVLMKRIGDKFFSDIRDYYNAIEIINENYHFSMVGNVPVIECLDIERKDKNNFFGRALSEKRRKLWGEGGVSVIPNNRPPDSIALKRYDNDIRVDFNRVQEDDHIEFIHPQGFFMVIRKTGRDKVKNYIREATKH
jgi:hypothetical protein